MKKNNCKKMKHIRKRPANAQEGIGGNEKRKNIYIRQNRKELHALCFSNDF